MSTTAAPEPKVTERAGTATLVALGVAVVVGVAFVFAFAT